MRTLVTGITGFVGGHLAEHLIDQGDQVVGCSRQGRWPDHLRHLQHRVRLLAADLAEQPATLRLFDQEAVEAVYHLAGMADPKACRRDPDKAHRDNVLATENVCAAIRQSGQRPRLLYVSTAYVYGRPRPDQLPVTTATAPQPEHPYARTKWEAEQCCLRFQQYMHLVRVRPFNHAGPRQSRNYIIADWSAQVAEMEAGHRPPVLRVGNLDSRRDYTDVRDVVRGYRLLLTTAPGGGLYNLGSGIAHSGRQILDLLQKLSRVPFAVEADTDRIRHDDIPLIVADAEPLRQLTGWQPRFDLATTIRDTLNFWRRLQGVES